MNALATKVQLDPYQSAVIDLRQSLGVQDQLSTGFDDELVTRTDTNWHVAGKPIKIAIADPHAIFRDGLRRLLSDEADFSVIAESSNPLALLASFDVIRPDLILIATPLDGVDGIQVLSTLQNKFPDIKVIIMSGGKNQDEFVNNVRAGARGIVQKSNSGSTLVKAIRKVYDGEFWLDQETTAEVVRHFSAHQPTRVEPTQGERENKLPMLSRREREIVNLVTQGYRNRELAEKLTISEQTVKNHLHNIFDKLGVSDRLELALYAIHNNMKGTEELKGA